MTAAAVQLKLVAQPSHGALVESDTSGLHPRPSESHDAGSCRRLTEKGCKHGSVEKRKRMKTKFHQRLASSQSLPETDLPMLPETQSLLDPSRTNAPPGLITSDDVLQHGQFFAGSHPLVPQSFQLTPAYSANAALQQHAISEASFDILEPVWSFDWHLQGGDEPGSIGLAHAKPGDQLAFSHLSDWACWNEFALWQEGLSWYSQLQGLDGQGGWQSWQRAEKQQLELPSSGLERCCTQLELDKLLPVSYGLPALAAPISAIPELAQTAMPHPEHSPLPTLPFEHSAPSLPGESSAYLKLRPGLSALMPPPGLSILMAPPGLEVMDPPSCQSDMPGAQTWSLEGDRETPSSASESTHGACSRSQSPSSSVDTQDTVQLKSPAL